MFYFFEIIYIAITIFVIGVIFAKDLNKEEILFSSKVAGLSIILHELFHKIVANILGYTAYYEVSFFGLLLGLFLKLVGSPVIFFIPGYVVILGSPSSLQQALISFAGPFANLVLWIFADYMFKKSNSEFYYYLKTINLWLFIINMLPIPPLDGWKVIQSLFSL